MTERRAQIEATILTWMHLGLLGFTVRGGYSTLILNDRFMGWKRQEGGEWREEVERGEVKLVESGFGVKMDRILAWKLK